MRYLLLLCCVAGVAAAQSDVELEGDALTRFQKTKGASHAGRDVRWDVPAKAFALPLRTAGGYALYVHQGVGILVDGRLDRTRRSAAPGRDRGGPRPRDGAHREGKAPRRARPRRLREVAHLPTAEPGEEVGPQGATSLAGPRRRRSSEASTSEFDSLRRAAALPRRRPPRAWERQGVASDATARRLRRGAAACGSSVGVGGPRRRRPPTSSVRDARDVRRTSAHNAPRRAAKPRTERALAFPCDHRASTSEVDCLRRAAALPRRRPTRAWERRGVASDATARRLRRGAAACESSVGVGGAAPTSPADADRPKRPRDVHRACAGNAPRRAAKPRTEARLGVPMRSPRVHVGVRRTSSFAADPASEFGACRRSRRIPRRKSARAVVRCESHVRVRFPSPRRRAPASTPDARMGAPGRRVRRAGPAASSGRGGMRVVRRRRGGRADVARRRRSSQAPRDVRRASADNAPRRAAKPRTEARLSVPMRSPRVHVGVRRTSSSAADPASEFGAHRPSRRIPR
jgi:hypothetical protein